MVCSIFSEIIDRLRRLSVLDVQAGWHFSNSDLTIADVTSSFSDWPVVCLNEKGHVAWESNRQVFWLAQKITVPPDLHNYPLHNLCLRLSLAWWAEDAQVYVNGALVQQGDLFDSSIRLVLSSSVTPGDQFVIALRLVSPGHDKGALVRSSCIYESSDSNLLDPGFVADEIISVLGWYEPILTNCSPENSIGDGEKFVKLELLTVLAELIEWESLPDREKFNESLSLFRRKILEAETGKEEEGNKGNFEINVGLPAPKKQKISLVGHAHLDLAWLWPVSETWIAAQRTFESVLSLQKDFPDLIFCHSTPALYEWVEKNRPDLFLQIQEKVKAGVWEVVGGMWVEPDLNLIGGESLVRQVLYGQRYCLEKFGRLMSVCWVPDTFGFCASLPQVLKQGGVEFFVTQKLRWNDTTKFPYGIFWWESLDGTQIFSYMSALIGESIEPVKMVKYAQEWESQTGLKISLWLPGVGDHGGGPSRDMLQVANRWKLSPFFPDLEFTQVEDFLSEVFRVLSGGEYAGFSKLNQFQASQNLPLSEISPNIPFSEIGNAGFSETVSSQASQNIPNSEISQNLPFSEIGNAGFSETPSSQASQNLPFSEIGNAGFSNSDSSPASQNLPLSEISQNLPLSEIGNAGFSETVSSPVSQNFPNSEISQNLPFSEIGNAGFSETPSSQASQNIPNSEISQNLPFSEIGNAGFSETPSSQASQNLPFSEIGNAGFSNSDSSPASQNLPLSEISQNLPLSEIGNAGFSETVSSPVSQNFPNSEISQNLPLSEIGNAGFSETVSFPASQNLPFSEIGNAGFSNSDSSQVSQNLPKTEITKTGFSETASSQASQNLPSSQESQNLPKTEISQNIPFSEISKTGISETASSQTSQNLPLSQVSQNLPLSEIGNAGFSETASSQVSQNLPLSEISQNIPFSEITKTGISETPSSQASQNIPKTEISQNIPKTEISQTTETRQNSLITNKEKSDTHTSNHIPIWKDELYLEFHRGCYTTHAEQKRKNRQSENLLYQAELFSSLATITTGKNYPKTDIEQSWKKTLFNQFHDILPGSSIPEVYTDANQDWQEVEQTTTTLLYSALNSLASQIQLPQPPHPNAQPIVIFNSLNWKRSEVVSLPLPDTQGYFQICDYSGNPLPCQLSHDSKILFLANDIPAVGYALFWLCRFNGPQEPSFFWPHLFHYETSITKSSENVKQNWQMENKFLRIEVNPKTGNLASVYDKINQKEISGEAEINQIQAFQDKGQYWDAWNIDPNYENHPLPLPELTSIAWIETGTIRQRLRVVRKIGQSEFKQDYILDVESGVLKIETRVNWQERHILVKAAFPLNLEADFATYEIAAGAIERTTKPQTPAEKAKWEVPAMRWGDLTQQNPEKYGVSLLNNCKYGYDAKPHQIRLSLLRGSTWPDPKADLGIHEFTYAIYPHAGTWKEAKTVQRGYELNMPLLVSEISPNQNNQNLPVRGSFLNLGAENLILMAFKKAEDTAEWILRCYECNGETAKLELKSDLGLQISGPVDILETRVENSEFLTIQPWKIAGFNVINP